MKKVWKAGNMLYPLPAVMVSCQRENEKPNIITVAWAGTVCSNPPMVSISIKKERFSHQIITESKEFVINLTTEELAYATDYCGVKSGRDIDKFDAMNLTPLPMEHVRTCGIAESPVNIECRVNRIIDLGSHTMFIADILGVIIDENYLDRDNRFALDEAKLIAYSHGHYYTLGREIGRFGYSVAKKNK